jgi:hypothetical protein
MRAKLCMYTVCKNLRNENLHLKHGHYLMKIPYYTGTKVKTWLPVSANGQGTWRQTKVCHFPCPHVWQILSPVEWLTNCSKIPSRHDIANSSDNLQLDLQNKDPLITYVQFCQTSLLIYLSRTHFKRPRGQTSVPDLEKLFPKDDW